MAFPIRVRPQVEGEILEAMAWYQDRAPALDLAFYQAYLDVLSVIAETPELYRRVRGDVRRVIFRRFPYALFYVFDGAEVVLLACLHEKRNPGLWPDRG